MPIVELVRVSKHFGRTRALDDVSLALEPGEVHVVAGENGAGKSTLIRILAGVHRDFQGTLEIDGQPVRFASPAEARRSGIAAIHQELSLVGPMSVADNLLLGEGGGFFGWTRRDERRIRELLAPLDLDVDVWTPIERLPLSVRQRIEIARALAQHARVLVMDEPTSALSEPEADKLFEHVRALAKAGNAVVFITHRMEEIYRVADRITVLRDGRLVTSAPAKELGPEALVKAMVGRALRSVDAPVAHAGTVLLEARDVSLSVSGRRILDRVSLTIHSGEVLGIAGLQGSGAVSLPYALCGALPASLELSIGGAPLLRPTPHRCLARGVVLVSGDRGKSLIRELSIADNAALSSLPKLSPGGWMRTERIRNAIEPLFAKLAVSFPSLDAPVRLLSGGNQQKVALARALLAEPRVMLLDEPTRGIDVGAKREVYALVRDLASRGVALLLTSSETDELMQLCDRIVVLARGRVVQVLERAEFSRAAIVSAAMGAVA